MTTYIVSRAGDNYKPVLHICEAASPHAAAQKAIEATKFSVPMTVTSPKNEPNTFLAYFAEDATEAEVLEGWNSCFDGLEVSVFFVRDIGSLLGKTLRAADLTEIQK